MTTTAIDEVARSSPRTDAPFPGLDPFSEESAPYFFGRDRVRNVVISNLEGSRLTLLYGASGVGKSSVLLAGVVPKLHGRALAELADRRPDDEAPFAVAVFRSWLGDPLPRLMDAICAAATEALGGEKLEPWRPGESPIGRLREWTERVRFLYVVLDQFEEYFLYHPPSDEPDSFDVVFAQMVNEPQLRVNVMLSLREDAWALLDRFKAKVPNLYDNYLRVDHLDLQAAREAITRPVDIYNELHRPNGKAFAVEPALVDALLESQELRARRTLGADAAPVLAEDDGAAPRIETPFLGLVLRTLWFKETESRSRKLRKKTLDELGGPRRIVDRHLQAAMEALAPDEQDIAAEVFHYLVTPSKSKYALSAADLVDYVGRPESEIRPVLDRLCAGNRILRRVIPPRGSSADDVEPQPRYEIFHDVLAEPILEWRARKLAEKQEREEHAAAQLELAAIRKRAARQRLRAVGYLVLAVVSLVGFVVAALAWQSAGHARDAARSQRWATAAMSDLALDPDRSVEDALRAVGGHQSPAARDALRAALPLSRLRAIIPSRYWATSVALGGPGGRYVAYGTPRGDVRLWDWRAAREVKRLVLPGWVDGVEFAAGGRLLLGHGEKTTLWDLGSCLRKAATLCPQHSWPSDTWYTAISPSGRWIATLSGTTLAVRARAACRPPAACNAAVTLDEAIADGAQSLAVTDRGLVAVLSTEDTDATARVWQARGHELRLLHALRTGSSSDDAVVFSPGGLVLAASGDRSMKLWDLDRCPVSTKPTSCPSLGSALHPDWTYTTAFSPDGLRTVTAAQDGVARIWERGATAPLLELRGHGDVVFAATFDRSGRYVATASADHTVRVWDVETGTVLRGNRSLVNAATFGDDGLVATAGADGTARLFDRAGREVAVLLVTAGRDVLTPAELRRGSPGSPRVTVPPRNGAPGAVNGVLFDPTGRTLVTADEDGRVLAWNVETCRRRFLCTASRELGSEPWPTAGIDVVATSTRGKLVAASADWDGVWLYDLDSRDVVARLRSSVETLATDFSRDGRYVLAATTTALRVWDVNGCFATATCKPPRPVTLPQSAIVLRAVFSRDGTRIITGATDRTARIWRWRDHHASPIELRGHTSNVRAVAFDPTGRYAVTGGGDMTTRVWDARSGEFLSVFGLHSAGINDVSFDPNNPSRILSASDDGTVTIHRCDTCGPFADVVRRASAREARVHRKPVWLPGDAPRP